MILNLTGQSSVITLDRVVFVIVNCMIRSFFLITLLLATAPGFSFSKDRDNDKGKDRFQQAGPIHVDRAGQRWVDRTLRRMSPEDKVGQLFAIWVRVRFMNDADPTFIQLDRKSTRLNSSHLARSRMPSSA